MSPPSDMEQPPVYPTTLASAQRNGSSLANGAPAVEREAPAEDESAAVNAHLENWAEAEHQRRKSVRHARRAEAFEEVANLGPIRRMSTRRRAHAAGGQARQDAASTTSAGTGEARAPQSSSVPDPQGAGSGHQAATQAATANDSSHPTGGRANALSPPSPARSGDHREVDMTRKNQARLGSNLGPNGGAAASGGNNKPNPTGARPIVTAGPAPVRAKYAEAPDADEPEPNSAEAAYEGEVKKEFAQDEKRKKRSFWLTDLLCCNFGSRQDEEQAAKTNPNE